MPSLQDFDREKIEILKFMVDQLIEFNQDYKSTLEIIEKDKLKNISDKQSAPKFQFIEPKTLEEIKKALLIDRWHELSKELKEYSRRIYALMQSEIIDKPGDYDKNSKCNFPGVYGKIAAEDINRSILDNLKILKERAISGYCARQIYFQLIEQSVRKTLRPTPSTPKSVPLADEPTSPETLIKQEDKSSQLSQSNATTTTTTSSSILQKIVNEFYDDEEKESKDYKIIKKAENFLQKYFSKATPEDLNDFLVIHEFLKKHPKPTELKLTSKEELIEKIRGCYRDFCLTLVFKNEHKDEKLCNEHKDEKLCEKMFSKLRNTFRCYNQLTTRITFHQENFRELGLEKEFLQSVNIDNYYSRLQKELPVVAITLIALNKDDKITELYNKTRELKDRDLSTQIKDCRTLLKLVPADSPLVDEMKKLENIALLTREMMGTYRKKSISCFGGPHIQRSGALTEIEASLKKAVIDFKSKILNGVQENNTNTIISKLVADLEKIKTDTWRSHNTHSWFKCVTNSRLVNGISNLLTHNDLRINK